jgi:hypothetical protein
MIQCRGIWLMGAVGFALANNPAAATSLTVYPNTGDLADTQGSVIGNSTASAPGFGSSSWQATGVKSNFYVTPEDLFGHSVTVDQVASMSYWTDQFSGFESNWGLYLYTAPTASDNSASWYKSRLVATPVASGPGWVDWTTATLDFSDPSRNNGTYTTNITWADITGGPVTWTSSNTSRDYGNETVEYFSLQTNSGATSFTGLLDGLGITLTDGESSSVNFEATSATPEPATFLLIGCALAGIAVHRRRKQPWL